MKQIKHKWGVHFFHNDTYWQKCLKCGVWRIHLMSKIYYSTNEGKGKLSNIRPECIQRGFTGLIPKIDEAPIDLNKVDDLDENIEKFLHYSQIKNRHSNTYL